METMHTPEPWFIPTDFLTYIQGKNQGITVPICALPGNWHIGEHNRHNFTRIVACVNACKGIADPSAVPELLEALKLAEEMIYCYALSDAYTWLGDLSVEKAQAHADKVVGPIRAAIAKATGQQ